MKLSPISLALVPLLTAMSASAAVNQVVDLGEVVDARATYATSVNDQGVAVLNGSGLSAIPIDLDKLDIDNELLDNLLSDEQRDELKSGVITAETHGILNRFLAGWPQQFQAIHTQQGRLNYTNAINDLTRRYSFQPIPLVSAFITEGGEVKPLNFLTNDVLTGNQEQVLGQNNLDIQVGFATPPFEYVQFTRVADPELLPEDAEIPEPSEHWLWKPVGAQQLGVVKIGDTTLTLDPVYTEFGGGSSMAHAINDEGLIIGVGSVSAGAGLEDLVEQFCKGLTAPVENCLHFLHEQQTYYTERALVWQLQSDFTVSSPVILGFLGDKGTNQPHPETDLAPVVYQSSALGVNNHGVIVGQSTYSDSDEIVVTEFIDHRFVPPRRIERRSLYNTVRASIFLEGEVLPIFPAGDRDWNRSAATAINNHNVVAGFAIPARSISGQFPRRMFYYDMNTEEVVFPEDLFVSANTQPRAINDQGVIVGRTEAIVASVKRQRAFKYNIATDKFVDLNTWLECDSPYTLVDATSINNSNEILATAVTEVPLRNSFGEVLLDEDGNPRTEFQARAVKLNPVANGEPSDCGVEDELVYDRKSATGSLWSALGLGLLLLWRRRLQRNG